MESRQSNRLSPSAKPVMIELGETGSNRWAPPVFYEPVTGPITFDSKRASYIIAPPAGRRHLLPAEDAERAAASSDVDLETAGPLRAHILDDGVLAALVPANRLPPGQVMVEKGQTGSHRWEPAGLTSTVTGSLSIDNTLERPGEHIMLNNLDKAGNVLARPDQIETRFALPAKKARQKLAESENFEDFEHFDLDAVLGKNFRATFSPEGDLEALVPANRLPPGQVMIGRGSAGSHIWEPAREQPLDGLPLILPLKSLTTITS